MEKEAASLKTKKNYSKPKTECLKPKPKKLEKKLQV